MSEKPVTMWNPLYEKALKVSAIEHGLRGEWDPSAAHTISDETVFTIWRDGITKIMAPREREKFLALTEAQQRVYFDLECFFHFRFFEEQFLGNIRTSGRATTH